MGTRSIIALKTGNGWFGRYCHWDGYPEGVGSAIWHIVKRDGLPTAVQTLITDNYSWSCLTASDEPAEGETYDSENFRRGYGYVHGDARPEDVITDNGDKWGTEYGYVLSREGMEVLRVDFDDFTYSMGFYRWDMDGEPDFVRRARKMFGQKVGA